MSEINNLPQYGGKIEKNVPIQPKQSEEPVCQDEECLDCQEQPNIVPDRGVLGQSQVKRPGSVSSDIAVFQQNPQLVKLADMFFEETLAKFEETGDPEAYEKTCLLQEAFVSELSSAQ